MRKRTKSAAKIDRAFHEVMHNPPARVTAAKRAGRSPADVHKMQVAIALSKARSRGARIPKR